MRGLCNTLAANPQSACAGLVYLNLHHLDVFIPVVMGAAGIFAGGYRLFHLVGHHSHHAGIWALHHKLNGISDGWAVGQQGNSRANVGEVAFQMRFQFAPKYFPVFECFGNDNQLGQIALHKFLIQRQVKTRRAITHKTGIALHFGLLGQPLLKLDRLFFGFLKCGALGPPQIHHDFQTVGIREKLLLNEFERIAATDKSQHGDRYRDPAVVNAHLNPAAEALVKRCVEHLRVALPVFGLFKQPIANVRHKNNCDKPRQHQGNGSNRKN